MSGAAQAADAARTSRAARAIDQADEGIGKWLKDLVTGEGNSPAQIIITGVLGVVPGVGQAFDVRDLILGIIALTRSPANPLVWVDMLITLVGCIPALGDAFKVCFKLVRQGHGIGRVLDGLRGVLKGDVDRWLRNIDWGMVASRAKGTLNDALESFIGALDSWFIKSVAGKGNVMQMIDELKGLKSIAPKRLDEAVNELKKLHRKILDDLPPASTAARNPPSGARAGAAEAAAGALPSAKARKPGSAHKATDKTAKNPGTPNTKKKDQTRESKKKRDNWHSGVLPEHITDYYVGRHYGNYSKVNDHGRKMEEHDKTRGAGIDHIWKNASYDSQVYVRSGGGGGKPYVIGETKGSLAGTFTFLAALPAELQAHFDALKADEGAAGATPKKAEVTTDQGLTKNKDSKGRWQQGLNRANDDTGLPTQMSHAWIARNVDRDATLVAAEARPLRQLVREFSRGRLTRPPYQRWVFMVTGKERSQHDKSKQTPPHVHNIRKPIVMIPDALLER